LGISHCAFPIFHLGATSLPTSATSSDTCSDVRLQWQMRNVECQMHNDRPTRAETANERDQTAMNGGSRPIWQQEICCTLVSSIAHLPLRIFHFSFGDDEPANLRPLSDQSSDVRLGSMTNAKC
jgi:hypothetical protein